MTDDQPTRLERWQNRNQWPLAVAAVVFLVAYAWPILQTDLNGHYRTLFYTVDSVVWIMFIVDYVVCLALADRRWHWFRHHLLDLAVIVLPFFGPLRLLRLLALVRVLGRRAAASLQGRIAVYVVAITLLLVGSASLAVLEAERHHAGSNIHSFGNAVWWAVTTISTVGYGDFYPVTVTGRLVATVLMLGGIALLGTVTAALAGWLVSSVQVAEDAADDAAQQAATQADVQALAAEIRELRALLAAGGPQREGA